MSSLPIKDGLLQFFNVDHGACALLTLPTPAGNKQVLIDCGHNSDFQGSPWYPAVYLQNNGISHVDLLVVTNYDEDHVSGAPNMVERGVTAGCVLGNPSVTPEALVALKTEYGMGNGIEVLVHTLRERQGRGTLHNPPDIPGLKLSWFWNKWPHWKEENDLSLVVHMSVHGFNFLFTGDIERKGFENLLTQLPGLAALVRDVDVLVAPHHGRENGKCEMLFDTYGCNPVLVVISDCEKKYQSQETVPYYRSKARGIDNFRGYGQRKVLTTRTNDVGSFYFSFEQGKCYVG